MLSDLHGFFGAPHLFQPGKDGEFALKWVFTKEHIEHRVVFMSTAHPVGVGHGDLRPRSTLGLALAHYGTTGDAKLTWYISVSIG